MRGRHGSVYKRNVETRRKGRRDGRKDVKVLAEDGSGEEWLRRLQRKRTRGEKKKVGREEVME